MTVTTTSMKLKFLEFADIDDSIIEFAIEEASYSGGGNWTRGYDIAVMYLSAHLISAGLASKIAIDTMLGSSDGLISKETIGRMSIAYKVDDPAAAAASNAGATVDDFESSSYGRRYLEMRDMNFGGPVIV